MAERISRKLQNADELTTKYGSINWEQDAFAYAQGYDEAAGRYLGLKAGEQTSVIMDSDRKCEDAEV